MIRPIVLYGDPILEEVSVEALKNQEEDIKKLIDDLFETMHRAQGIGLSAIQIGVPIRVFVIEAHLEEENFHFRKAFINPIIQKQWGDLVKHPEGCLSIPGLAGVVERPEKLELGYYDEKWDPHVEIFDGYAARIIQHEYDHLEGILYIDHLDQMWKKALESPLEIIAERQMEGVSYAWK